MECLFGFYEGDTRVSNFSLRKKGCPSFLFLLIFYLFSAFYSCLVSTMSLTARRAPSAAARNKRRCKRMRMPETGMVWSISLLRLVPSRRPTRRWLSPERRRCLGSVSRQCRVSRRGVLRVVWRCEELSSWKIWKEWSMTSSWIAWMA